MAAPKPVTITQRAAVAGERKPVPLVIVGTPILLPAGQNVVEVGTAVMVAGVKVVNTANAKTASVIQLTTQNLGTVTSPKTVGVTARVNGTSFTITSADATDTSTVGYVIYA